MKYLTRVKEKWTSQSTVADWQSVILLIIATYRAENCQPPTGRMIVCPESILCLNIY